MPRKHCPAPRGNFTPRDSSTARVSGIMPSPQDLSIGGTEPSETITLNPFCRTAMAAANPAGPPPTTNTSVLSCDATTRPPFDIFKPGAFALEIILLPRSPRKCQLRVISLAQTVYNAMQLFAALDVDGPTCHSKRFCPECRRRFRQLHDVANCPNKFIELFRCHNQWWGGFQDHKIVSADLREDSFFTKHAHHHDLPEHCGMNAVKSFVQRTYCQ